MGPTKPPSQRTISSFFTPKAPKPKPSTPTFSSPAPAPMPTTSSPIPMPTTSSPVPASTPHPSPPPTAALEAPESDSDVPPTTQTRRLRRRAPKRPLAESSDEELYRMPGPKKSRRGRDDEDFEVDEEAEADDEKERTVLVVPSMVSNGGSNDIGIGKGKGVLERTSRFRFGSQGNGQGQDGNGGGEGVEERERKAVTHERFVKKLAGPDSVLQRRMGDDGEGADEDGAMAEAEAEDDDDDPSPIIKKFGKGAAASKSTSKPKGKSKSKLTPLEQQVLTIKRKHPDTVLLVEVGYKYRFFGSDALTASQNLSIMCIPGKLRFDDHPSEAHHERFASASIPVPRLHVHVKRLVESGYKVGIVRQRETAALKAAGDNRNAPFVRELTNLYTKGTYIDDLDESPGDAAGGGTGYLLCITEKAGGGTGTDERAHIGLVAVQPATGDVVYDEFDDGFMRTEVETRLLHIAPCEFLIVGELTKATEKLVSHLANTTTVFGEGVRIERVPRSAKKGEALANATRHVASFYADKVKSTSGGETANKLLDTATALPDLVTVCLSAMITHLSAYGLEHVLDLTTYFAPFSGRAHMLLNGNTLSSLEVYRNQTDHGVRGSLCWALDRTKTKPGRRLLRKWVGRPLLHKGALEERIAAVEEILSGKNGKLDRIRELLGKTTGDLEKGLIRIYYGKCTRPELFSTLQTMERVANAFPGVHDPEEVGFKSRILNEAVAALPRVKEAVEGFLGLFRHQAATRDDKYDFFKDESKYEAIVEHKLGIAAVESELKEHLKQIAKILKKPKASYVSVSGLEYLIEVPNDKPHLSLVPASWSKQSSTKKHSRFHTPTVVNLLRERDQHKESLSASCDAAYASFLAQISNHYQPLRDTINALATLDCLFSLATVAAQPGYTKPTFSDEIGVRVEDARHPMIEQLLLTPYVPNPISLTESSPSLLITGPNMGGKSSYIRTVALISIMAQIGSYVPASSATLGLLDAVYTRMGAWDNMMAGESTFMVELSETSDILREATGRSLVVLDELGRGTSTHDGVAIAEAVLREVVERGCLCLFVTHYPQLAGVAAALGVRRAHVGFEEKKGEDGADDITFLYQLVEGVAHRSYGLNVAKLANLPKKVLDVAAVKSQQLESHMKERQAVRWANSVISAVKNDESFDAEKLLTELQYL